MKAANLKGLDFESVVALRNHGVTEELVREAQRHGFHDLTVEQLIKLKNFHVLE